MADGAELATSDPLMIMNPVAVLQLTGNLANGEIVQEVRGRLEQARDKLAVA